jgi:transposase
MASHAARARPNREIKDLKKRIGEVVEAVLDGTQDRGRAAVAIQGFNSLRGVLELERKLKELDDLAARLEALERAGGDGKEKRWATSNGG